MVRASSRSTSSAQVLVQSCGQTDATISVLGLARAAPPSGAMVGGTLLSCGRQDNVTPAVAEAPSYNPLIVLSALSLARVGAQRVSSPRSGEVARRAGGAGDLVLVTGLMIFVAGLGVPFIKTTSGP